jgi:hypothetical protein
MPLFWHERVDDMRTIHNQLDEIERAAPLIQGRMDHDCIAVADTRPNHTRLVFHLGCDSLIRKATRKSISPSRG